ncbi:MAG: hypothetical protein WCY53_04475 [Sphaerochaetaceae bacterium]
MVRLRYLISAIFLTVILIVLAYTADTQKYNFDSKEHHFSVQSITSTIDKI